MIVKNPTDSEISIQFNGVKYTVAANSETPNVPAQVAQHWQENVHNFVTISEDAPRGSVENPMTREEAVVELGKEVVEKIEAEAITVESLDKLPEDVVATPVVAAKKAAKKVAKK